jgi:hypothetical protein
MGDVGSRVVDGSGIGSEAPSVQTPAEHGALGRYAPLATASVVAIALALRLPWPTVWWLNPDEGIYYAAVTRTDFSGFLAEAKLTAHPPLYFLILRGVAAFTTDFGWLRSVAWVSGVAAVYVFIAIGRELGGRGNRGLVTGLLAGLLLAGSPRAIGLSEVVRPYMLLLLLLAGALLALLRYTRQPSAGRLGAYVACSSLALMLHYSAALAFGVFVSLVLLDGALSGFARPPWLRLAAAQLAPVLTLAALYAWHLRGLMRSTMADQALEGWLGSFMIHSPADLWLGFVGFHSAVVGEALAVPAALLTLIALVLAAWSRRWVPLVIGGSGIVLASAGALVHLYPLGATRHTSWLMVFVTPILAWAAVSLATAPRRLRGPSIMLLAALLVGARPLGSALDSERRPHEISERVLRADYMQAMAPVLDASGPPTLVVMSTETYQLLMPFYTVERQRAERSPDGSLLHFRWGVRDVVVVPDRDFLVLPAQIGSVNHLYTAMERANRDFGVAWPADGRVLVLAGGWRSQGMEDLAELSRRVGYLGTTTYVPGFIAVRLDLSAYALSLGLTPPGADPN